jgi:hypothetical protein
MVQTVDARPNSAAPKTNGAEVAVDTEATSAVGSASADPAAPPPNNCGQQCTSHGDCTGSCNYCGPEGKCEEGVLVKRAEPTASHFKPLGPKKAKLF